MKFVALSLFFFHQALRGCINRILKFNYKYLMCKCGKKVHFSPLSSFFSYKNVAMGNNVYIGPHAIFMAANSKIYIGNHVVLGPKVTLIGGDHNINEIGKFIIDTKEKGQDDDKDIIIEDDVWIGANVTILKGCTIGRGAVVGAGSLVTKNIPDYAIAVGIPSKVIRFRWNIETIIEHEKLVYPVDKRKSREYLGSIMTQTVS